jgi:hypothetical protein
MRSAAAIGFNGRSATSRAPHRLASQGRYRRRLARGVQGAGAATPSGRPSGHAQFFLASGTQQMTAARTPAVTAGDVAGGLVLTATVVLWCIALHLLGG